MLSHLPKIGALTLLSLSIAACSSNNHNNNNSIKPTPIPNSSSSDAEKAAAIEANRVALVAKAKAAGLTDAQATAYAAANKEATAAAAQKALDNLVAEKLAAEKAAAEKAEAERLAKIEANRVALVAKAKAAGLTDAQATAYAAANKEATAAAAQKALDNLVAEKLAAEKAAAEKAAAEKQKEIDDAKGLTSYYPINTITANFNGGKAKSNNITTASGTQSVVYNQPYSVVLGNYSGDLSYNNKTGALISDDRTSNIKIQGLKTTVDAIPTLGTATYTGKAFNGAYIDTTTIDYSGMIPSISTTSKLAEGTLDYNINFTDRLGSGSITGLGNTISLEQGSISGTGITSTAKQLTNTGTYSLDFYGKKAEEIAGKVIFNGKDTVGFGGTRGEITK